ncbi:MAG: AAA family ATPase, partial [Thermoanaerobaculia bacterium]
MQATNLQEMLRYFDPGRPLAGEEELSSWFLDRPESPRKRIRALLEAGDEPRKILFAGHPGSGKTTELAKLATELAPDFQILHVDALEITGGTSLSIADVIWAIAERFSRFANMRLDRTTEDLSKIISQLQQAADEIRVQSGARLLLVIEGLDKVDPELARDLLRDYTAPISALRRVDMIYVVPAVLRLFTDFHRIREGFSDFQLLPNLSIYRPNGDRDLGTLESLLWLVRTRASDNLLEPEALAPLLRTNGGVPRQLVALVRSAALHALARDADRVSRSDAENAAGELRRELVASLDDEDAEILRTRHADRRFIAGPREIRLFAQGSLIEYPGDIPWCDAHPLLWPFLENDNGAKAAPWEPDSERREVPDSPAEVYFRSVELKDVKGIREAHLELAETAADAPGWYVFAGGNGAGKSTLLRSLALAMPGLARLIDGSWVRTGAESATAAITLLAPDMEKEIVSSYEIPLDGDLTTSVSEEVEDFRQGWFVAGY